MTNKMLRKILQFKLTRILKHSTIALRPIICLMITRFERIDESMLRKALLQKSLRDIASRAGNERMTNRTAQIKWRLANEDLEAGV
jgi:hypothetical protein